MTTLPNIGSAVQGYGSIGVGTFQQLTKSLQGHPELVQFIDPASSTVIMHFDAVMSENHTRDSTPTAFAVESGSNISDHIAVSPFELQLQCVITDSPLGDKSALITQGVATVLTAVSPLAVAAGGIAYGAFNTLNNVKSRSVTAWQKLLRYQAGDPTASPPVLPKIFNVKTKYGFYKSMVIQSISLPRDASATAAIVFTVNMTQILVVRPKAVNVAVLANSALAAAKLSEGEQGSDEVNAVTRGRILGNAAVGHPIGPDTAVFGGISK